MSAVATTKMSSRGQVVIPEGLRKAYGWASGTSFLVLGRKNAIILQPIALPDLFQFDSLIAASRQQAKAAGLKPCDITAAIRETRADKRSKKR